MDYALTRNPCHAGGVFSCDGSDEGITGDYGLVNEQRVLKELNRRRLPFQHRVRIGDYEIDFLVGKKIIVEVDGYIHALKEVVTKDTSKQEYLEAKGFTILRITGAEAKNKGLLRDFGRRVQCLYEEDEKRDKAEECLPLKQTIPKDGLHSFKLKLEQEELRQNKLQHKPPAEPSDEELFLKAIADLTKSRRKY